MSTITSTTLSPQRGNTATTAVSLTAPSQPSHQPTTATEGGPPTPEIRPYDPETDRAGIEAVFRDVYTPLYRFSGLTTIAWIVFCRSYLDFSPETCYVLVTPTAVGSQDILGYIVGTLSSSTFCASFATNQGSCRTDIENTPAAPRSEEMRNPELAKHCMAYFRQRNQWVSALSSGLPGIEEIVFSKAKALLADNYPAHFHMALAPAVQGRGFGVKLVGAFFEGLRATGEGEVRGVFAATTAENERADRLYGRCGFEGLRSPEGEEVGVLGGGEGEMEGKVFLVREIK